MTLTTWNLQHYVTQGDPNTEKGLRGSKVSILNVGQHCFRLSFIVLFSGGASFNYSSLINSSGSQPGGWGPFTGSQDKKSGREMNM